MGQNVNENKANDEGRHCKKSEIFGDYKAHTCIDAARSMNT